MSVNRLVLVAALLSSGLARAQSSDGGVAPDGGAPSDGSALVDGGAPSSAETRSPRHAGSPIAAALDEFDFGDYQSVVNRLRPLAENGARELPNPADRLEALRIYGIACTLTDRQTAAEGAFLLLLREQPAMRLDPELVRPEAVEFFEEVRARHRKELVAAYRQGRPRYYYVLDLIPTAGQFQNHEWKKGVAIGTTELLLLGSTILTGSLLSSWQGADHTFAGHTSAYAPLRDVDIISFSLLLGVTVYGIIDSFVVGAQQQKHERQREIQLGF